MKFKSSLIEKGDDLIKLNLELSLSDVKALKNALVEYLDGEDSMITYNQIIRKLSTLINNN